MRIAEEPFQVTRPARFSSRIWRIEDELSAARGHDIDRLFAEARERQKRSGHRVVSLQEGQTANPDIAHPGATVR